IAVHGGQCALTGSQYAKVTTNAGTAAWSAHRCPCAGKRFQVSQTHGFQVDLARGWNNYHTRLRMNGLALQDAGGDGEIIKATVRTGAEKDLVDLDMLN